MAAMAKAEIAFGAEQDYVRPAWRRPIDEALATPGGPEAMAAALYRLLPSLQEEAREEAVFEMVALLPDDNYGMARTLLLDTSTSPAVFSVLLVDLQHRTDELKLPLLAQIAQQLPPREGVIEVLQKSLPELQVSDRALWSDAVAAHLARKKAR